jgi:hypothetical protein
MKQPGQNTPCIIYSVLAVAIVIVYIVLTSKTSVHARQAIEQEKHQNKNSSVFMHVYDVAVIYGIIILLLNLLLIGSVLHLLCVGGYYKLSYSIIVLVVTLWVTYIVVAIQSYENIDSDIKKIIQ